MPGSVEGNSPTYISSHSADVILSDIRPIKLKIEALQCINVLLDEFLYNILSAARSLTTDKLRAGLLSVLPTTLGKEALLEAEVELRAYWDRTKRSKNASAEDDSDTFSLQWAFELLRLKCEAYSTLNESDGDKGAEAQLQERMTGSGQPPKASLVAPAALYLTAILEAMCEHILSNVGRVASRDSSRTYANTHDVFVALCEDESIYGLFKTMNVYEQIEQLSQAPKPRRSKSISRGDRLSMSRTSSVNHQDSSSRKESPTPPPAHRLSSEGSTLTPSMTASRSSFDRAKSVKKIMNGRHSNDGSINGHKRSESILSDDTKQTWSAFNQFEDDASLQEFDDLMKSDSTMKVSLTPDRLKTMEVYKQEKDQRGSRSRPAPLLFGNPDSESSNPPPSRPTNKRPSVPHVDSIKEDEEEAHTKLTANHRTRQSSVTSPPKPSSSVIGRVRSHSTASAGNRVQRKPSKTKLPSLTLSQVSPPIPAMQTREFRAPKILDDGLPQRTRKIQHNRESMDLDDVMAGSEDEEDEAVAPPKDVSTPVKRSPARGVSASTRELMDFLNEGPPDVPAQPPLSKAGRDLVTFLAEGPPDSGFSPVSMDNGKAKPSGRLQRMMSKLSLGNSEKARQAQAQAQIQDDLMRRGPPSTPSSIRPPPLSMKSSAGSLSALGNKPIPPRPPQPQMISPPSSPSQGSAELPSTATSSNTPSRQRQTSVTRKLPAVWDQDTATPIPTPFAPVAAHNTVVQQNGHSSALAPAPVADSKDKMQEKGAENPQNVVPAVVLNEKSVKSSSESTVSKRSLSRASPPSIQTERKASPVNVPDTLALSPSSAGGISAGDAQDMRRLLLKATSTDECRLIMDMFLAKSGIPVEPTDYDVPYPSPSPSDAADTRPSSIDTALEISLVELFLGGETAHEPAPRKKKYSSKRVPVDTAATNQPLPSSGNAISAATVASVVAEA